MAKKPIFVTLDEELHARMKSTAPLRKLTLQGAYDEALRDWLGERSKPEALDAPSPQEMPFVNAVLHLLRTGNEDTRELVKAVLKPGLGKLKHKPQKEAKAS